MSEQARATQCERSDTRSVGGLEDHSDESCWRRFQSRARSYFRRKLGDGHWVDELVQEACVRAWSSHLRCRRERIPVRAKHAWLDGISWRVLMDHFRASARTRRQASCARDVARVSSDARDTRTTVAGHELELIDALSLLEETVERLPPNWRAAVRERMRGASMREIADSQGLTLNTVRMRLYRGRVRLRRAILDRLEEMDR
jgi:RNA polymerase sigma factor (sigma-70 family)